MDYLFAQLKTRITISLTLAALGIYVYNKYDDFPSFNDCKLKIMNTFGFRYQKTITNVGSLSEEQTAEFIDEQMKED